MARQCSFRRLLCCRPRQNRRAGRAGRGFALAELMVALGIVSILASAAIPAYQDYVARAMITEGLLAGTSYATQVTETYAAAAQMPATASMGNLGVLPFDRAQYVSQVQYTQATSSISCILVTFKQNGRLRLPANGTMLLFVGTGSANDVVWQCALPESGGVPSRLLPPNCRQQLTFTPRVSVCSGSANVAQAAPSGNGSDSGNDSGNDPSGQSSQEGGGSDQGNPQGDANGNAGESQQGDSSQTAGRDQ